MKELDEKIKTEAESWEEIKMKKKVFRNRIKKEVVEK